MIYIKIWGLKRSGTNYLRWLLEENFRDTKVLMDIFGWKHGPPVVTQDQRFWWPEWKPGTMIHLTQQLLTSPVKHVLISKCLPNWIASMKRYYEMSELNPGLLHHLCMEYVGRQTQFDIFTQIHPDTSVYIPYEGMIEDPGFLLAAVQDRFDLTRSHDLWHLSEHRFERGNDGMKATDCQVKAKFDAEYVTGKLYLNDLSDAEKMIIGGYCEL